MTRMLPSLGALLSLLLGQPALAQTPVTSAWDDWSRWTSPAPITSMAVRDSLLWMSTRAGLARIPIAGGPATVYTTRNSGIPFDTLTSVDLAYEGEVLSGSPAGAIVLQENGSWMAYHPPTAPLGTKDGIRPVSGFSRTPDGKLWMSTGACITNQVDLNQYPPNPVNRYFISDTASGKIYQFDGQDRETMAEGTAMSHYYVESMLGLANDGAGRIWGVSHFWDVELRWVKVYQFGAMAANPWEYLGEFAFGHARSQSWLSGYQATPKGLWVSGHGTNICGSHRCLLFFPADSVVRIGKIIPLDSLPSSDMDATHPTQVFALDTAAHPWVLAGNTLYGIDPDGNRTGTETLPAELAAKGPFREMRFDRQGILFLRTDSAVYWKVKPKPVQVGVLRAEPGPKSLLRRKPGVGMTYQWSGGFPGEYFHLNGRRLRIIEVGKTPASKAP